MDEEKDVISSEELMVAVSKLDDYRRLILAIHSSTGCRVQTDDKGFKKRSISSNYDTKHLVVIEDTAKGIEIYREEISSNL